MTDLPKDYIRNKNTGELHDKLRATEQCNIDDMTDKELIDVVEFIEHASVEYAHLCSHCWPESYEAWLNHLGVD